MLANGFARVRCTACGDELLVAFSCKGRGFCPSCTSRRMYDTAASLVNRVIPNVPVASVGLVAAALGALSARPRSDADHSHARHCLAHHLRPPAPISPPLRSAGAAHGGDHLRAALRRSAQPQCALPLHHPRRGVRAREREGALRRAGTALGCRGGGAAPHDGGASRAGAAPSACIRGGRGETARCARWRATGGLELAGDGGTGELAGKKACGLPRWLLAPRRGAPARERPRRARTSLWLRS